MVRVNYPSIELVSQALEYAHGSLFWRVRPLEHFVSYRAYRIWNTRFPGEEAGYPDFFEHGNCYRWLICLSGEYIYRSVIVWALHHGVWPTSDVDHIAPNNPLDDRLENLRLATHSQNKANSTKYSNNTSGYKGVTWDRDRSRWKAQICVNRKKIYLGLYDTPEESHAEYRRAAIKHFGEFAHF